MHNETFYTEKDINEFKLALISDIHYYPEYNQKIFNKIIKQLKNNKPNYICIVGDTLDSSNTTDLKKLKDFLIEISKIAPVIVVTGNHDEKEGSFGKWKYLKNNDLIKLYNEIENIHFLNDTTYTINNISFYGFNPSFKYYEIDNESYESFINEIKDLKCNINNTTYNIILSHSPINIYNFIKNNPHHNLNRSDLILSGHMHNGCIPFIISHPLNKLFKTSRGIISPTRGLFPKYAQGRIYERDGFVYEGITKLSHSTKIFHIFDFLYQKNVEFITIKPKKH